MHLICRTREARQTDNHPQEFIFLTICVQPWSYLRLTSSTKKTGDELRLKKEKVLYHQQIGGEWWRFLCGFFPTWKPSTNPFRFVNKSILQCPIQRRRRISSMKASPRILTLGLPLIIMEKFIDWHAPSIPFPPSSPKAISSKDVIKRVPIRHIRCHL